MVVTFTLLRTDGSEEARDMDLPELPDIYDLRELLRPMVDGFPDHYCVLNGGRRTDLFAAEFSALDRRPRNEAATAIYRAGWLSHHPKDDPEGLPAIYGPAVVTSRRIWF